MNKGFKFRIYPDAEQRELFAKTFGCARFIYNRMLGDKIAYYEETGGQLHTTPAQYKDEFPWLREVDSLALCNAQLNLEKAYNNFFDNQAGFPNFKSRRQGDNRYTTNLVNGNIALGDGFLKLPKVGMVKVKQHRAIPSGYRLKSVTVSLSPSGKYHASVLYEYDAKITPVTPINILGLDFSMKELYIDSNGDAPEFPRHYRRAQEKLGRMQRALSKMTKHSKNYAKQKKKIARFHERIANQRKDFLHKQSRRIANAHDSVAVEDLDMRGMARALNFGKSVHDNGWGMFTRFLGYKLTDRGKQLIKVSKWFPSSKKRSACGAIKDELSMSERVYICDCGNILDRDINAAINIKNEATRMLALA